MSTVDTRKPAYAVPSMADIAEVPYSGLVAASTFSGCGGSSLGYRLAGFRVRYANEFIRPAAETYRANFPDTYIDPRDIRAVSGDDILRESGELDLLDGSPPCASFSLSGKREVGWGEVKKYSETKQRVDDLFFEFLRVVRETRPRAVVAENVPGLATGKAKGYYKDILSGFGDAGYRVRAKILDAQWLGVPQRRRRLIFVGFREDLDIDPVFPSPLPYRYTLGEAIGGLEAPVEETSSIEPYAIYREWYKLRPGEGSDKYINLVRAAMHKPCDTVTQTASNPGAAGVCHPAEPRKFSIAELRRICGFPDDFVLTGTYSQQYERLGRAVPPPVMAAVAARVRDRLMEALSQ